MNKKEYIIIVVIFIISIIFILFNYFKDNDSNIGYIYYNNEIIYEFNIFVDKVYYIKGNYGDLYVEVKDQKWRVINEECPNHICSKMGYRYKGHIDTSLITCIPNGVVIVGPYE